MKYILHLFLIFSYANLYEAQCVVNSSNGYSVEIYVNPISVVAPNSCPYGYNYNIILQYDVTYKGTPPSGLYTLQGNLKCGSHTLFFDLPNSSGSGTTTTTSNPYRSNSDCSTSTVSTLGCQNSDIQIEGPGISDRTILCPPSSLPVELNYFEVLYSKDNAVELIWQTESELNNDYFTIERSKDAFNWDIIGNINGHGNSTSPISYNLTDNYPGDGILYYRLKQTDLDGEYSYSKIIAIQIAETEKYTVYPNPSNAVINITGKEINSFVIVDIMGRNVTSNTSIISKHSKELSLDVSNLRKGNYVIINNEFKTKFTKL